MAGARDDEVLYRIGFCSEKALPELVALVDPARFNPAHYRDTSQLKPFLGWVRSERGYYPQFSEGDSVWRYDGGAYRELLAQHPLSPYADDAAFLLVRLDFLRANDPALFYGDRKAGGTAARAVISAYDGFLARYPGTNREHECREIISAWKLYISGGGPPAEWLWLND